MSTHVAVDGAAHAARPEVTSAPATIALLGCGGVGTALTRLLARRQPGRQLRIARALVRTASRVRDVEDAPPFTEDPRAIFTPLPDVVVELLGGCEPARTLVLEALERCVPVVTANKSLLARHGPELRAAARTTGTPLLYEAAVLAGVPFLGTFARRPFADSASSLTGILNGTSNFVLTTCRRTGTGPAEAVAEAQRLGYAEPDPHHDVAGIDAAEKLVVLLQQFARTDAAVADLEVEGIAAITPAAVADAAELGGTIKPVVHANWSGELEAFAGPAFVPAGHALHGVDGPENALILETLRGRLLFQGPGAGPAVTAATVLDDVNEALSGGCAAWPAAVPCRGVAPPETGWLVAITAPRLPTPLDVADHLASHGVYVRRTGEARPDGGLRRQALLTWPSDRGRLEAALRGLAGSTGCRCTQLRALEVVP